MLIHQPDHIFLYAGGLVHESCTWLRIHFLLLLSRISVEDVSFFAAGVLLIP